MRAGYLSDVMSSFTLWELDFTKLSNTSECTGARNNMAHTHTLSHNSPLPVRRKWTSLKRAPPPPSFYVQLLACLAFPFPRNIGLNVKHPAKG